MNRRELQELQMKISRGQSQYKVVPNQKLVKRCPNCSKSFKVDFYSDHLSVCKPQRQIKQVKHLLDPHPKAQAQPLSLNMRKTLYKSEKKEGVCKNGRLRGSSFRIKNTPKIMQKIDKEIKKQKVQESLRDSFYVQQKKEEVHKQVKEQKKEQVQKQQQIILPVEESVIEETQNQLNRNTPNVNISSEPLPEQRTSSFNSQMPHQSQFPMSLRNPRIGSNFNIQALVHNTNSIIAFVTFLNERIQHPIFIVMINQLSQLNQITDTVNQLSRNRLSPYNMANIFAEKVHDIQVTIVNRIGVILQQLFAQSFGRDFEQFVNNEPQFKTGFTEQQLQKLFPQGTCIQQTECPICLQQIIKYSMGIQLQCSHLFHSHCIRQWLKSNKKCPMCRQEQKSH